MSTDSSPQRIHLASALIVLATFLAGAATGAGIATSLHRRPPPPPHGPGHGPPSGPPWLEALGLTDEQRTQAKPAFDRHRAAVEAVLEQSFPRMQAANTALENELRALLSKDQQQKLDELIRTRPAFPGGHPRPGGPGFGPPPGMGPPGRGPPGMGPPGPPPHERGPGPGERGPPPSEFGDPSMRPPPPAGDERP